MSQQGWTTVTLGDIAENISVRVDDPSKSGLERFVGLVHLDSGSVTVSRWDSAESVTSSMKRFQAGDVLLARRNAHLRRASAVDFEGVCSGDAYVLREKLDAIVPGLLKYILNTNRFWEYAIANADGSMSTWVKWNHLQSYPIYLEESHEMEFTVKLLDALTDFSNATQIVTMCNSSLRNTFENGLFKKMLDNQIECEVAILGNITDHVSDGPFGSKLKSVHYSDSGARVVRLQNIGLSNFRGEDEAYISEEYYNSDMTRYALKAEDIVLAGLGDETHIIGRCFMVKQEMLPAIHKADCFCIRPSDSINSKYLMYYLNSTICQMEIRRYSQGGTRMRINGTNLKKIRVPIPSIELQNMIADFLSFSRGISSEWLNHPMGGNTVVKQISELKIR